MTEAQRPAREDMSRAHGTTEERKSFVSDQYEHLWRGVLEKATGLLESGERDLSRLHLLMRRNFGAEFSDPALAEKYRNHEMEKLKDGFLHDKQIIRIHDLDSRVVTLMTDAVKMREVATAFGHDMQRVVETGAGWGKVLFNIWLYGGPGKAEYWALEPTVAGRQIAELIARESSANITLKTAPFDYYAPDFSMLAEERSTGFVTHHSIEQMPEISGDYIEAMLAVPGFRRCVHLEPIGWQIPSNSWLVDAKKKEMTRIDEANERFATKRNQNKNLYPLLREFEKRGDIRMHVCRKFLCSHLMSNATSLIVWGPGEGKRSDAELRNPRRDDLS